MPVVTHRSTRQKSTDGPRRVSARWASVRCRYTVVATIETWVTTRPASTAMGTFTNGSSRSEDPPSPGTLAYLLVGREPVPASPDVRHAAVPAIPAATAYPCARHGDRRDGEQPGHEGPHPRGRPRPVRRARIQRHEPERHRRQGWHPPPEPPAPLPFQGGPVPGRARRRLRRLVRARRRGDRRPPEAGVAAGRTGAAGCVPLLRGTPRVRPPSPVGGSRRRPDAVGGAGNDVEASVPARNRVSRARDGRRPVTTLRRAAAAPHRLRRRALVSLGRAVDHVAARRRSVGSRDARNTT